MKAARGFDHETIVDETVEDNIYAIRKGQTEADKFNAEFPAASQLSWRDVVSMPMPEGQTIALQDPAAIKVQAENKPEPAPKPAAKRKRATKGAANVT